MSIDYCTSVTDLVVRTMELREVAVVAMLPGHSGSTLLTVRELFSSGAAEWCKILGVYSFNGRVISFLLPQVLNQPNLGASAERIKYIQDSLGVMWLGENPYANVFPGR